jgi:tripartite-type tricarboxylate transporter receptor subunit TctC
MQRRHLVCAATLLCFAWGSAMAQTPAANAPIRILVGAPAGGSTDTMARVVAHAMGQQLGRTVVVENRPGAGGNLAAEAVARAAPDGQTLLMSFTSHAINASLYPRLSFDPIKDFTPLTLVSTSPSVLVAHPSLPANNVAELIALAKSKPDSLNYASAGSGTFPHLAIELFKMQAGISVAHIPYKGAAPALNALLAGDVQVLCNDMLTGSQYVKSGKLRALAYTGTSRAPTLPQIPTMAEAGLKDYVAVG